jgi:DNA primase
VSAARSDHAREIRYALTDVRRVCETLGLLAARGSFVRQHGGLIIRCPWHDDRSPSCSVRLGADGTIAIRCHACGATGDVLSLVAAARDLSIRTDFRQVLHEAASMAGLWDIVRELDSGAPSPPRAAARPAPAPIPDRDYPPKNEVDALWSACTPVAGDPEAASVLAQRALDPELVDGDHLARAIPLDAALPRWAAYRGRPWIDTGHRLLVPMWDPSGELRTVRAWRVTAGDSPKRLPPGGYKAAGVVMADALGLAMLRGTADLRRIVVTEGESDFLTWAIRPKRVPTAVVGIVSGSFSPALAERFPFGALVIVRTDRDEAGDRYARELQHGLRRRCFLRRGGPRQ